MANAVGGAAKGVTKGAGKLNVGMEMLSGTVSMSHHFVVRIDRSEYDLGSWATASGLSVKWAKCEHRPGGQGNELVIWPGVPTYDNIKLTRAACADSATVQKWLGANATRPKPLSGAIQLVDWLGMPVVQWRLEWFVPINWEIDTFTAAGAKPVIETLKLAHTGFLA